MFYHYLFDDTTSVCPNLDVCPRILSKSFVVLEA